MSVASKRKRGIRPGMPIGGTSYSLRARQAVDPVYNGQFRRRLEVWGRARANDRSVHVIFGTSGSFTDMKGNITVDKTVPPDGKPGDKALATWGLMSHEMCHHRWTSRAVWEEFLVKMKKDMKKGDRGASDARSEMRQIPGYEDAMNAHAEERKLTYEAGVLTHRIADMRVKAKGLTGAEAKDAKRLLSQMEKEQAKLAKAAQAARSKRDAIIGPNKDEFDRLTAKLHQAIRLRRKAEQVKDMFNIIEDGRIETHLRVHEPVEYHKISLLNKVYPRIPETYSTGDSEVLVPLGADIPVDADGNELPIVDGPDGQKLVCIPANTKMRVFTPYPVDLKRQLRGALLAESVPEFSVPDGQLHPHVAACLEECRPFIDAGVRGNTRECLEASRKVWEICAKHGLMPDPEDEPSNTGGDQGGQQQGGGGESGDQQQGGGGGGGGESGGQEGGDQQQSGGGGGGGGESGDQQGGGDQQQGGSGQSGDEQKDDPSKGANGTGGKRGPSDKEGDSGSPFGGEDGGDEWNDRGDSGGDGDGTGDTQAGKAEEGEDGGGITKDQREQAEKNQAGSASKGEAAEAAKKAEQDADDDKKREEGEARRSAGRGNHEAADWTPPGSSAIQGRDEITPKGTPPVPRGPMTRYGNRLAAVFEKMKSDAEGPERFQESGRLDRRRLHRAPTGDTRLFWHDGQNFDQDISVSAVYDLSGSMGGHRKELQEAAVTIDIALKKVKIPHDAWGFDGAYGHDASHYEFKSFGKPDKDAFGAIAGQQQVGGGGTPTASAVEFSTARMAQRKEESRIMMVFTDGMPTSGGTKETIEKARKQGITVMGCFFNPHGDKSGLRGSNPDNDAMKELFGEDYVSLTDISDLAPALGKKLLSLMKSKNRK